MMSISESLTSYSDQQLYQNMEPSIKMKKLEKIWVQAKERTDAFHLFKAALSYVNRVPIDFLDEGEEHHVDKVSEQEEADLKKLKADYKKVGLSTLFNKDNLRQLREWEVKIIFDRGTYQIDEIMDKIEVLRLTELDASQRSLNLVGKIVACVKSIEWVFSKSYLDLYRVFPEKFALNVSLQIQSKDLAGLQDLYRSPDC
jgi:hypothetical protein